MAVGPDNGTIMMETPPTALETIAPAEAACRPWPRHLLSQADWAATAEAAAAQSRVLLAHWADPAQVHALFLDLEACGAVAVSTPVEAGLYPALSPMLPAAALYERMIHDLYGHGAAGAANHRPWLDHGAWPESHPMATRSGAPRPQPDPLDTVEDGMVLPIGPIQGLIEAAAHLRLTLAGPVIRRAEARLGFTHKGTMALMRGKSPRNAARFAARLSADSTVAHSLAFAEAAEAALDTAAPPRAGRLRIVMLEAERIAGHLDTLAEIGRLAGARSVWTQCGTLREGLLRACHQAFGHRLMMDCVVPGGVAADIAEGGAAALHRALGEISARLPAVRRQHDGTPLASRLSGLGCAGGAIAVLFGAGGVAGRAGGRAFDARAGLMPAYSALPARPVWQTAGDAAARQAVRSSEIEESLRLIGVALESLPAGPVGVALPQVSGEGIACAESIRGDIWHWLRIDHGQIAAAFPRDSGWALWPLAEAVLQGAMAEDAALIRTSLALPVSGMDL
jgi:Ni,Fe-hydrogenase III large subunit